MQRSKIVRYTFLTGLFLNLTLVCSPSEIFADEEFADVVVGVVASAATGGVPVATLADCDLDNFGSTAIAAAQDTAQSASDASAAFAQGDFIGGAVNSAETVYNACDTVVSGVCEVANAATLGLASGAASIVTGTMKGIGNLIGGIF